MNLDSRENLSELIKKLVAQSRSRNAFARDLGVAPATVIAWEKGESIPDRESLLKLTTKTGYSIQELLGMSYGKTSVEHPSVERILRELERLPREEVARIIRKATDILVMVG